MATVPALSVEALSLLHEISLAIGEARESAPLLRKILETTARAIGCDAGLVRLWDRDEQALVLSVSFGLSPGFISKAEPLALGEALPGEVADRRTSAWLRTENLPDVPLKGLFQAEGLKAVIAAPLLSAGTLVGVLVFHSRRPRDFSDADLKLLTAIGNQLGPVVENTRLLEANAEVAYRLGEVLDITRRLVSSRNPKALLRAIIEGARRLTGARYAALAIFDESERRVVEFIPSGLDAETEARLRAGGFPRGRGLFAALMSERRPIRLGDLTRDPRHEGFPSVHPEMRTFLGVPIIFEERLLGCLYLTEKEGGAPFSRVDEQSTTALAAEAAIAIEQSRFYAREREQRLRLEKLAEIDRSLAGELDPERLLPAILSRAVELLKGEGGGIYSWDERGQALKARVTQGYGEWVNELRIRPGEGVVGRVFQEQRGMMVSGYPAWAERIDDFVAEGSQAVIAGILAFGGETFGVIAVDRRTPDLPFTEEDLLLLQDLATRAAAALNTARLVSSLQEQLRALKETQEQLIQSEKLKALGDLTAGMAHELNNPLSVVMGRIQLLEEEENLPGATRRQLARIREQAERMARVIENLLIFSRRRTERREPTELNRVVEKALELLAPSLRRDQIEASFSPDPAIPRISADSYQLQQVVMNLIQNARQAMRLRGRGRLAVRTRRCPEPSCVMIEVEDNGPGIPPEILTRIFDPFVTTKEPGEGTGLGLSICYTIVSAHGGTIRAENLPEGGARFTVKIPALPPPEPLSESVSAGLPSIEGVRVLVVEDEAAVREMLHDLLGQIGAVAEEAASGSEALALLRKSRFDLVTLDFRMPEMNAPEVWGLIRRDFPDLPIVLITGDIMGPEVTEFVNRSGAPLIHKPFSLAEVQRVIASALGR
jgi:signal transduction histidine kinase